MRTQLWTLFASILSVVPAFAGPEAPLPPEGKAAYAVHSLLMDELRREYPADVQRQVNDNQDRLYSLTVYQGAFRVDGKTPLVLPERVVRVIELFETLQVEGDVKGVEKARIGAPAQDVELFSMKPASFTIKVKKLRLPASDAPIVFSGTGVIKRLILADKKGVSVAFDFSPYRPLGGDKPVKPAVASLDLTAWRAIEGARDLDRARYFRVYSAPCAQRPEHEAYIQSMNFLPGRQMFNFGPSLEQHAWNPKAPTLREDPKRPGHANLSFFAAYDNDVFKDMKKTYGDASFTMCFNNWPSFMSVDRGRKGRGTPKVECFDAAAELAAAFIRDQIRDSGATVDHWEVKNESTVEPEWAYHFTGADSWKLLADFHIKVADAIRAIDPRIKVGGPTSAYMKFEAGKQPFELWRNQARFMDLTKGKLDFYSHHFYEPGSAFALADEQLSGYDGYAMGRLGAELDTIANHMRATDNVKPLVISEFGALTEADIDIGMWKNLKARDAYYFTFLERPDRFDMVVPFTLGFIHWDKESWGGLFRLKDPSAKPGQYEFELTRQSWLLELWKEFRGRRVAARSDDPMLLTHAVVDGDTARLALHNLRGQRLAVRLDTLLPEGVATKNARVTRIYFDTGALQMDRDQPIDLAAALSMQVEETALVTIALSRAPAIARTIDERAFWGDRVVVKNDGRPIAVEIAAPVESPGRKLIAAQARLGLYREGGFDHPVSLTMGGKTFEIDMSDTKGVTSCFVTKNVDIPVDLVGPRNALSVRIVDTDAWLLSSRIVAFVEESTGPPPRRP